MHEIVTLQFGKQSNYLGTHFWNTQVSLRRLALFTFLLACFFVNWPLYPLPIVVPRHEWQVVTLQAISFGEYTAASAFGHAHEKARSHIASPPIHLFFTPLTFQGIVLYVSARGRVAGQP
jgi:hypothetical protein